MTVGKAFNFIVAVFAICDGEGTTLLFAVFFLQSA